MFWTSDGTEQAAYTGQSEYINIQTRRNGFIPREGFALKYPNDRVAENRTNLTVGIILREKGYILLNWIGYWNARQI